MVENSEEIKSVRDAIQQMTTYTEKQVKSVDLNLPITITVFLANLVLAYCFKTLVIYWIVTSFLLMAIWTLYSCLKTFMKPFKKESFNEVEEALNKFGVDTINYGFSWLFEALGPLVKATSVLFTITFLGLLLIGVKIVPTSDNVYLLWPILVSLYYIISQILYGNTMDCTPMSGQVGLGGSGGVGRYFVE